MFCEASRSTRCIWRFEEVWRPWGLAGLGRAIPLVAPQWRPKLVKEVYIYRLMAHHGVRSIPRILHAAPFGIPELPLAHIVMTRLPGRPLATARLSPADAAGVYRRMGELLAAVHRIDQPLWGYLTTRVVDKAHVEAAVSLGLLRPEVADAARRQVKRKPQLRVSRG